MGIGTLRRYHEPLTKAAARKSAAAKAVADEAPEAEASDKHGDLDMPNRGSSKQDWLEYTAADPAGSPEGYEELTRDALAELYMGPRAE